ncbi:disease resistance protein-like [Dorcoceras hygrometricum]|uniref:Disease resistance protein-like n=1 Tax=Dorcoceras hygrometricum TaxID=472368 RepID=A0A2Z7CEW1_9LAMI|nr:disease resistance protein-like [Dorcoceras hygrometricum]
MGIDQLGFQSVQLGYLKILQMGNADPNNTKAGKEYEHRPHAKMLSGTESMKSAEEMLKKKMNSRSLESVAQELVSAMMMSAYLLEKATSSNDDKSRFSNHDVIISVEEACGSNHDVIISFEEACGSNRDVIVSIIDADEETEADSRNRNSENSN